jgi:hypothetical protein
MLPPSTGLLCQPTWKTRCLRLQEAEERLVPTNETTRHDNPQDNPNIKFSAVSICPILVSSDPYKNICSIKRWVGKLWVQRKGRLWVAEDNGETAREGRGGVPVSEIILTYYQRILHQLWRMEYEERAREKGRSRSRATNELNLNSKTSCRSAFRIILRIKVANSTHTYLMTITSTRIQCQN